MNYERIYSEFIADRLTKQPSKPTYFEKHHIKPRSLGGGNEPENIVKLTMEDHIRAHILLAKIYGGNLWGALFFMTKKTVGRTRSLNRIPSKYEMRAALFAKKMFLANWDAASHPMYGKKHHQESRQKMSIAHKARGSMGLIWTQQNKNLVSGDNHWTRQEKNRAKKEECHAIWAESLKAACLANTGENNVMHRPEVAAKIRASSKAHAKNGTGGFSKAAIEKNLAAHRTDSYRAAARARVSGYKNPNFGLMAGDNFNSRQVLCIETGVVFNSVKEAGLFCGGDVTKAARTGGTAGGFHWKRLSAHATDGRATKYEGKDIATSAAQY